MKVLIVDDNANDRWLLRYNLAKHGCETVIEARDGREGYELAKVHNPDLIISDALMPGVDGFELLRMLKSNNELKGVTFVFHSSIYTGLKDREFALSLGAEAFIAKPKEPEELWEELCVVLKECEAGGARPVFTEPMGEEKEYFKRYSGVVASKLEEKVRELEETLKERKRAGEALRASEIRYRRLFEASKDGIIILYANTGKIIDVNPFMIDLLGYPTEEYLGKNLFDTGPFRETEAGKTVLRELRSQEYLRCYNLSLKTIDGNPVDVEFISCAYSIDEEMVIQCNIRDITERKRGEEALRESEIQRCRLQAELAYAAQVQAMMEELNSTLEKRVHEEVTKNREKDIVLIQQNRMAALGEMFDHIAHQWKQPLNGISLVIQALGSISAHEQVTTKNILETADSIMGMVGHMAQTVDVFRDFYRPDKEKSFFLVKNSIEKALSFITPVLSRYGIEVDIDADPQLLAFGYPKEYSQALLNIMANAKDAFIERGIENPRIMIKAFADGDNAVVTITDNAGGIPDESIERIFDLYFTTKESSGGTGIGLYMSKNIIVKNMGGKLTVSNINNGAKFRIELALRNTSSFASNPTKLPLIRGGLKASALIRDD